MPKIFNAGSVQPFVLNHIASQLAVGEQATVVVPATYPALSNPPTLTSQFDLVSLSPDRHQVTILRK
jgi:hypothetical protein